MEDSREVGNASAAVAMAAAAATTAARRHLQQAMWRDAAMQKLLVRLALVSDPVASFTIGRQVRLTLNCDPRCECDAMHLLPHKCECLTQKAICNASAAWDGIFREVLEV